MLEKHLALIVVLFFVHKVASQMGPTNTPITGTFVGFDGIQLCKYCQINCMDIPVFVSGSCQSTYYTYGCDIKNACANIKSANKFEFFTAVALCASFNKCKFQPFLSDSFSYVNTATNVRQYAPHLMDVLLYQDVGFTWRTAITKLPTGADYFSSRTAVTTEAQSTISKQLDDIKSLERASEFTSVVNSTEKTRTLRYLYDNTYRLLEQLSSQGKSIYGQVSYEELQELKRLDEETKRRRYREIILLNVQPSIPPAIYLYYKFVQDNKLDPSLGLQLQVPDGTLPAWFKNTLKLIKLEKADEVGLALQLKKGNVRLDRLMDWVNNYATAHYKEYFDAYMAMLEAGTQIRDQYVNLRQRQFCSEQEARNYGVTYSAVLPPTECNAVNKKNEQNAILDTLDQAMNTEFRELIASFAMEAGLMETPYSIPPKDIGAVALTLFFRFPNYSASRQCYLISVSGNISTGTNIACRS